MRNPTIVFLGSRYKSTSYSQDVNNLYEGLIELGFKVLIESEISNILEERIYIHYNFEDDFSEYHIQGISNYIAFRTWDFGPYPPVWVEKIKSDCKQLWVYSHWTKDKAIEAGIPAKMVHVIPLGIFPNRFFRTKKVNPYSLNTEKSFRFMFTGGVIYRKGIDILLEAYTTEFTAKDDVTLIIKGNSEDVFYKDILHTDKISKIIEDKDNPEIIFIDDFLSWEEMNNLFNSVDVGVFPYRSEGFAKPILELMSVGVPSIVPNFGPCKDYCTENSSYIIPTKKIILPIQQEFVYNTMGYKVMLESVEFSELSSQVLSKEMRRVFDNRQEIESKSLFGERFVKENYLWSHTMDKIVAAINEID